MPDVLIAGAGRPRVTRRAFVVAVSGLAVAPGVLAQRPTGGIRTIGILEYASRASLEPWLASFKASLREAGFEEGRNLRIEYRFADYDHYKLGRLAEELLREKVEVLYAPTTWPLYAAQAVTRTLPIVFSGVNDPVAHKFVQSLARPGGNITGVSPASAELTAKRIELMRELFPRADRLGVVYDEDSARACGIELKDIGDAGKQLGVDVRQFPYAAVGDLDEAFDRARRAGIVAMLVPTTYETRRFGPELTSRSSLNRIPLIHENRSAVEAGGLMSYGPELFWGSRRAAAYVARILGGAKPAELPVERPNRYELTINLKTARALGITIPPSIVLRADRIVE